MLSVDHVPLQYRHPPTVCHPYQPPAFTACCYCCSRDSAAAQEEEDSQHYSGCSSHGGRRWVAAEVGCLLGCQHSSPWCRWDQHRWGEPHSNQPVGSTCSLPSSGLAECTAEEGDSTAAVGRPSTQFPKEAGVLVSCGDGKHGREGRKQSKCKEEPGRQTPIDPTNTSLSIGNSSHQHQDICRVRNHFRALRAVSPALMAAPSRSCSCCVWYRK